MLKYNYEKKRSVLDYSSNWGDFFILLAIKFIYINIIIPEPYSAELKICLEQARQNQPQQKVDTEENKCFRKYPHFN